MSLGVLLLLLLLLHVYKPCLPCAGLLNTSRNRSRAPGTRHASAAQPPLMTALFVLAGLLC